MLSEKETEKAKKKVLSYLKKAKIAVNPEKDLGKMEFSDYELGNFEKYGISMIVYVNTKRVCAKEIVLYPWQTCIQHKHVTIDECPGKEETFRCRYGDFFLYIPGIETLSSKAKIQPEDRKYFTVWNEIVFHPGDQFTLYPDTWHWFQAGEKGAIISEFSTPSTNAYDIYYNKNAKRISKY